MELKQHFANLAKTFSAKFPELQELAPLYILAFVVIKIDFGNQWMGIINGFTGLINPQLINANSIDIDSLSKNEIKEILSYLIEECLEIAKRLARTPKSYTTFMSQLAEREPQAAWNEGSEERTYEETLERVTAEMSRADSTIFFNLGNRRQFLIDLGKLSNQGFKEFAELQISQAVRFGLQELFPSEDLNKFLVQIINPEPNQEIIDPYCSVGLLFVELHRKFPEHNLNFTGYVENSFTYLICTANLLANGIKAYIFQSNPLEDASNNDSFPESDIAAAVLPFRMHVGREDLDEDFFKDALTISKAEFAFVELMISNLDNKGKVVVVVSENFLFSERGKIFRKKCVENDLIENVISLSKEIFQPYSSIKTSIVVFNKNKSEKGVIVFDGKDDKSLSKFETTKITIEKLKSDKNFDLRASRYALRSRNELRNVLAQSQYPTKRIGNMVESAITGENYSPKTTQQTIESSDNLPYVRVSELSDNETSFNLNLSAIKRSVPRQKIRRGIVDFSAILVNKLGVKLKPTYFEFSGKPIAIGSDVIALKLKKNFDIEYFLIQLQSQLVQTQVEALSAGTFINRISKEDFLNIEVILPPLEEQRRQILETKAFIAEKADLIEKSAKAEEQIAQTEYDVIATISHNLNQKLGGIVNDYDSLMRFLRNKEKLNSAFTFEDFLRPVRQGEVPENIETFEKVANRLKDNLTDATKTLKTTESILQKNSISPEPTEIIEFLKKEIKLFFECPDFSIDVDSRLKALTVPLDQSAFKDAVRNLIENARRHGFENSERGYHIVFEVSKYIDSIGVQFARILYKNDGRPFPKGFTFNEYKRLAGRAGKTKGTGLGGFFINKVIDLHQGEFNFIDVNEHSLESYKVQFEILLPLAD